MVNETLPLAPLKNVYHIGASWIGHAIEDHCGCVQAGCGLVTFGQNLDCQYHNWERTIRQGHKAVDCINGNLK